ncbi:hypothetical protein Ddye_028279 [Dipteronia dyeriana]|uniref:Uncharacterized protein n=1 Tax=Dipteronia dyeriana TaxID=168575 RepID=A0AAD9WR07_9ROSI|nr:hypothetical protein Ddye_028279 [Dipteronia dyeriana]
MVSKAFHLRVDKQRIMDEDDEDPWLAPDKFNHFIFYFSFTLLFSTLASFSRYPSLRSHSISVESIMSLLAPPRSSPNWRIYLLGRLLEQWMVI